MAPSKKAARLWLNKLVKDQLEDAKKQLEKTIGRKVTFDDTVISLLRKSESKYLREVLTENARLREAIEKMLENRQKERSDGFVSDADIDLIRELK